MYDVSNAANAKFPCLYCMHGRTKESSGRNVWDNGIGKIAAPYRDGMMRVGGDWVPKDANWDPFSLYHYQGFTFVHYMPLCL